MTSKIRSTITAAILAITVAGCGGDDVTATPIPPLAPDASGETVYQARCASCHGADLRGTSEGPSQLSIVYEPGHHGDDSYRSAIRNGVRQHHWGFGDMPAVPDITDGQIESVIEYIRTEQQRNGFEP